MIRKPTITPKQATELVQAIVDYKVAMQRILGDRAGELSSPLLAGLKLTTADNELIIAAMRETKP